jgi:phosphoenolpyruvate carboxylase
MLPGWYGFGSAVDGYLARIRTAWPPCAGCSSPGPSSSSLLSNMDMVLAKTDLAIASRYAELVADAELRERIFSASRPNGR